MGHKPRPKYHQCNCEERLEEWHKLSLFGGIIGVARTCDPRNRKLSVTRIEGICSCPFQAMLTRILGIETSCDETAAAVVDDRVHVRSSIVASQKNSG